MSIEQQAKGGKQGDVRYLTPLDIDTKQVKKYCRFKKNGIKYIDYKDADFLLYLVNEQGIAQTDLKPIGRVTINGTNFEAKTFGEFIDSGKTIVVVGTENQYVLVKEK